MAASRLFNLSTCVLFWVRFVLCSTSNGTSSPRPLSFPPSLEWDGNDGAWSSFVVQIGTPPQVVRLLPSTSANSIWTVLTIGCDDSAGNDCAESRGGLFNLNASSTWQDKGLYGLPLNPLHYLPYSGNADFGFDNITLDFPGHGGSTVSRQVITGFVTDDFYVGSLGLSPKPVLITLSPSDQFPGFLESLTQQNLTPSMSWGYLAGASYYSYPTTAYGSLTFGGYDSTRVDLKKNLTLAGGVDEYRPILLGVESITSGDDSLLSEPIVAALDSSVTQMWLPISACQAFEDAFGLVWNETYSLYILSDAQHSTLLSRNASITFTLSTGISDSPDRLNITLPYGAFDLTASAPLAGNQTLKYFPLKRADNETQYTLGRTLLQEVYMIADYSRGQITLYPGIYPEGNTKPNIVTICPPNSTTCIDSSHPATTPSKKLSTGVIVGIAIGIVLVLVILASIAFVVLRRPKPPTPVADTSDSRVEKPELANTEMRISHNELEAPYRYAGNHPIAHEESGSSIPRHELADNYPAAPEAEARERHELQG